MTCCFKINEADTWNPVYLSPHDCGSPFLANSAGTVYAMVSVIVSKTYKGAPEQSFGTNHLLEGVLRGEHDSGSNKASDAQRCG